MNLLRAWIYFSALVLVVSLAVHLSTFCGVDPMAAIPGVMFLHVTIFPPFFAAIVYAGNLTRDRGLTQQQLFKVAPAWMQRMSGIFFAYAMINFIVFLFLVKGGSPEQRDGMYVLADHGRVVRQLSESEYHQMQAYVVRGFSGHWMLFSSAALTLLTGAANARKAPETRNVI
jgi:hypothetical protein